MKRTLCYLLPLYALIFFACKKNKNTPGNEVYIFKSESNINYSADLYGSKEDYLNQINPIKHLVLPAMQETPIPLSELTEGKNYYIDYYSDDYANGNWLLADNSDAVRQGIYSSNNLNFTVVKDGIFFIKGYPRPGRKVMVGKNGTSSWKAYDAYYEYSAIDKKSVWDTLSDNRRYLVLNCSFYKVEVLDKDQNGLVVSHPNAYPYLDFASEGVATMFNLHFSGPTATLRNASIPLFLNDYPTPDMKGSNDTLAFCTNNGNITYMLKRL